MAEILGLLPHEIPVLVSSCLLKTQQILLSAHNAPMGGSYAKIRH
jgi:hypothetical protein